KTSSNCCPASTRASALAVGSPGCSRTPTTVATTGGTCAGSRTAASSASHTPSANRPATRLATSAASLVFPDPPGPVTVTSRCPASRPATSATAPARPTKLVSAGANPCTPPATAPAADRPTTITITAAASGRQPRHAQRSRTPAGHDTASEATPARARSGIADPGHSQRRDGRAPGAWQHGRMRERQAPEEPGPGRRIEAVTGAWLPGATTAGAATAGTGEAGTGEAGIGGAGTALAGTASAGAGGEPEFLINLGTSHPSAH